MMVRQDRSCQSCGVPASNFSAMGIQGEFFERPAVRVAVADEMKLEERITAVAAGPGEEGSSLTGDRPSENGSVPTPANGSVTVSHAATKRSMKDLSIPKLYYSISEVSRLTGLEPYVLRYWESEFDELKPQKNRAGNRVYSNRDIKFILRIKELLREKRYTIEGAKHILKTERVSVPDGSAVHEEVAATNDPSQIPLPTETKSAPPQATITLDDIRAMKEALLSLKEILRKG
jgi:DNA-binding transcriptional MerR regulator